LSVSASVIFKFRGAMQDFNDREKSNEIRRPGATPLDNLPVRLEKGDLFVEWEQFKVGIPEKVRA